MLCGFIGTIQFVMDGQETGHHRGRSRRLAPSIYFAEDYVRRDVIMPVINWPNCVRHEFAHAPGKAANSRHWGPVGVVMPVINWPNCVRHEFAHTPGKAANSRQWVSYFR